MARLAAFDMDGTLLMPDHRLGEKTLNTLKRLRDLLADIAARTLFTPWELATGIMTALVGAPVFIFMASRMFK